MTAAGIVLAALWCGPASAQQVRYAEATPTGGYGGGLIEYLVTGRSDGANRSWPQANRAVQRQAAITAGDRVPPYGEASTLPYAAPVEPIEPASRSYPQEPDYRVSQAMDPQFLRQEVDFAGPQRPGTILVDTNAKHLYLVQPGHRAIRYGIGVGRPGFAWSGLKTVSRKAEWPDWIPPAEMLARRPDLPRHMAGGPANPLGARALYLGSSLYRIHGTNEPGTIGRNVSSGCIRMMNEDVIDLYERVPVGTRVEVL
ncbi:lipoprotein-anchoring transpeptidase ErfK/SrfK [Methylobacterium persicinum]|uniref:Lipoprotein-anchoring transpeptidase ErfK/SrfK n=1 Tax=Methylobacterium persicinum TaxID=374426 RepID=A0ABU0HJ07_9HYPH|nr:lipoprotein-anchoring transpeptidase ErfK/SrfK [Methylobacterium persicinum]GJE37251.1 hypothetical protein KHHGKMAE_1307 [Methylobacterium persicinum]